MRQRDNNGRGEHQSKKGGSIVLFKGQGEIPKEWTLFKFGSNRILEDRCCYREDILPGS